MINLKGLVNELLNEAKTEPSLLDVDSKRMLGELDRMQKDIDLVKRGFKKSPPWTGRELRLFATSLDKIEGRTKRLAKLIDAGLKRLLGPRPGGDAAEREWKRVSAMFQSNVK